MDPVTHGLLGASAALAAFGGRIGRRAAVAGLAGGLFPDVDIFLAPVSDPALPFELHRHFTHALGLAPVFGALAAAPLLLVPRWRDTPWLLLGAGVVGCVTHGLLDQMTSYGTHLWWPFFAGRTSSDTLSIVDPIVTLPLLVALALALFLKRPRAAGAGLAVVAIYTGLGFVQRERALSVQRELAAARGDTIEHGRAMPTLGNMILWRSLYRTADGTMRADAVRLPFWGKAVVREGAEAERIAVLDEHAPPGSAERARLERLAAFADGFVLARALPGSSSTVLFDARYSMDTAGFEPLWGVRVDRFRAIGGDRLAWHSGDARRSERAGELLAEILGTAPVVPATPDAEPAP